MTSPTWLGIDLGGTSTKWQHVSDSGDLLASGQVPTPSTGHEAVTAAIAGLVNAVGSGADRPRAVGIAVPGHLSPQRDSITVLPNVAGDWVGYPVQSRLESLTGYSPALLNDARAFALAELELGAARSCTDVVFVTVGTGVGGAVAVDGRVVRSRRDSVGELGHTTAVIDGERCTCGHHGCVEAYAGGAQMLARARRQGLDLPAHASALVELGALQATSAVAARVLAQAYDALAVGVSNACAFAGAKVVVIGGGVAQELPGFLDRCRSRLAGRRALLGEVDVRAAALGVRAGALGAALSARQGALAARVAEPVG